MINLFIIGNGFDLAHGLPTSYRNFRDFLISRCPDYVQDELPIIPESCVGPRGDLIFDDTEAQKIILYLLDQVSNDDGNWNELEADLGKIDYSELFEDILPLGGDNDSSLWHNARNMEDRSNSIVAPISAISDYFRDWIDTVNLDKVKPNEHFMEMINPDEDHFLTFNYTETLEKLYSAANVCHIHGTAGERLHFGHGDSERVFDVNNVAHIGSEDGLNQIHRALRKDTRSALTANNSFFEQLEEASISKVYSYGFSYSSVDMIYVKRVVESINSSTVIWYLHNYVSCKERDRHINRIKKCGFLGTFAEFEA